VKEREKKEKEQHYAAFKKGKRTLQEVLNYIKGKAEI